MQPCRFPLERIDEIRQRPDDFRIIERIPLHKDMTLPFWLNKPEPRERTHTVVFLDLETTGMTAGFDKIIEIGLVRCTYAFDRKILLSIDKIYGAYEDPKKPIPPEITQFTGITDAMVEGAVLDSNMTAQLLSGKPLAVAHNASFDRPFFDLRFPSLGDLSWACSMKGINWDKLGFNGRKLDYLNLMHGWFYEGHRAVNDCLAAAWLMYVNPQAFAMLIDSAKSKDYTVYAQGAPFEIKDKLKSMGYRFDGKKKVWYINVKTKAAADQQIQALGSMYDASQAVCTVLEARTRFKG